MLPIKTFDKFKFNYFNDFAPHPRTFEDLKDGKLGLPEMSDWDRVGPRYGGDKNERYVGRVKGGTFVIHCLDNIARIMSDRFMVSTAIQDALSRLNDKYTVLDVFPEEIKVN